jgi:hypothetical protein
MPRLRNSLLWNSPGIRQVLRVETLQRTAQICNVQNDLVTQKTKEEVPGSITDRLPYSRGLILR